MAFVSFTLAVREHKNMHLLTTTVMHVKCFQTTCHYTSSALTAFIPNSTGMAGIKVGIGPARMLSVLPPALARHLEMCHPK